MKTIFREQTIEVVLTGVAQTEDVAFEGYLTQQLNDRFVVRQWRAFPTPLGYRIEMQGRIHSTRWEVFFDCPTWNLGLEVASTAKR